jgi:hypothetical protein
VVLDVVVLMVVFVAVVVLIVVVTVSEVEDGDQLVVPGVGAVVDPPQVSRSGYLGPLMASQSMSLDL